MKPKSIMIDDVKYVREDSILQKADTIEGMEVAATFDIRGREYNGRYFNNLQGWKLHRLLARPAHRLRMAKDCERAAPIAGKHDSMARFAYSHASDGQTVCHNFVQKKSR